MQLIQSSITTSSIASRPATACAAVISGPREISVETFPVKQPGPYEVLVRLEGCGVCASNIPVWQGRPWFDYPLEPGAPGHEGWGEVEATGRNVSNVVVGDRVAFLSNHAFAKYDVTASDQLVKLPASFAKQVFPGEPLACAMNIFRRSEITAGQTVAIVGIGFLGALLTQLAANSGAHVIAVSRREFALDIARRFGATVTVTSADPDEVKQEVLDVTSNEGCDCVIEAVGHQSSLDLATELTHERGKLVIAGYHQ
ncbi:MAG: zinc-binding dehydrogenase, partial [Pyrinomonadaceae bacterium]